jgi:hypothetical protein
MKISKNLIYLVALFTIFSLFNSALGQDFPIKQPPESTPITTAGSVKDLLLNLFQWAFKILTWVAGALGVIYIIWGGINTIIQGKIDEGKNRLIYGVVGVVIALIAYALVVMIHNIIVSGGVGV